MNKANLEAMTIDVGDSGFSLQVLELALRLLNEHGEVTIRSVEPGTVNLLLLGAALYRIGQEQASK